MSRRARGIQIARSRPVVTTALKVALLVGSVLALINHGPAMMRLMLSFENICQILLTYLVPYTVSTYSAVVATLREEDRQRDTLAPS